MLFNTLCSSSVIISDPTQLVLYFCREHMNTDVDSSKLEPQPGLGPRVIGMSIVLRHDIAV